jgi:hypothetical protein
MDVMVKSIMNAFVVLQDFDQYEVEMHEDLIITDNISQVKYEEDILTGM